MKLSDIVVADAVIPELRTTHRNSVISEMVESLAVSLGLDERTSESVTEAVIRRETLGSTAIGKGMAIPHAKHPDITSPVATIARSSIGVDFAALDHRKGHVIVLLLSPFDDSVEHLKTMRMFYRVLEDDMVHHLLQEADSKEKMNEVILEADGLHHT
jgi:mannitol/fructose-specific phosphotransferase system IIA component (Ntr-type)